MRFSARLPVVKAKAGAGLSARLQRITSITANGEDMNAASLGAKNNAGHITGSLKLIFLLRRIWRSENMLRRQGRWHRPVWIFCHQANH